MSENANALAPANTKTTTIRGLQVTMNFPAEKNIEAENLIYKILVDRIFSNAKKVDV